MYACYIFLIFATYGVLISSANHDKWHFHEISQLEEDAQPIISNFQNIHEHVFEVPPLVQLISQASKSPLMGALQTNFKHCFESENIFQILRSEIAGKEIIVKHLILIIFHESLLEWAEKTFCLGSVQTTRIDSLVFGQDPLHPP
jgi:hypothetical protein